MPSRRRLQARLGGKSWATNGKSKSVDSRRLQSTGANKPGRPVAVSQLSARVYSIYTRVLKVLSFAREGTKLTPAARRADISVSTVLRYLPGDFQKLPGTHHYVPSKSDKHIRFINVLLADGKEHTLRVRGSRQATLASDFSNAFQRYLAGDTLALRPFRGKTVAGRKLLTNPKKIKEIGEKGYEVDRFYSEVVA